MRKQIMRGELQETRTPEPEWLDLDQLVQVELTSEDVEHPIESALLANAGKGWRSQLQGKQTIRLLFDKPHRIRRIQVLFQEDEQARTQEFLLRWSADGGESYRDIVRQQYNFSPPTVTRELEDYFVDLDGMEILELSIVPDISGGDSRASLVQLRLA